MWWFGMKSGTTGAGPTGIAAPGSGGGLGEGPNTRLLLGREGERERDVEGDTRGERDSEGGRRRRRFLLGGVP